MIDNETEEYYMSVTEHPDRSYYELVYGMLILVIVGSSLFRSFFYMKAFHLNRERRLNFNNVIILFLVYRHACGLRVCCTINSLPKSLPAPCGSLTRLLPEGFSISFPVTWMKVIFALHQSNATNSRIFIL